LTASFSAALIGLSSYLWLINLALRLPGAGPVHPVSACVILIIDLIRTTDNKTYRGRFRLTVITQN